MNKKYQILVVLSLSLLFLTGCQSIGNFFKTTQEQFLGLSGTLRTFDENSQVIDKITGKSKKVVAAIGSKSTGTSQVASQLSNNQ